MKIVDDDNLTYFWGKAKEYIDENDVKTPATTSEDGLMSSSDKTKLDALPGSITSGTEDKTPGSSPLTTGHIYVMYE